jgi:hypothetical protein
MTQSMLMPPKRNSSMPVIIITNPKPVPILDEVCALSDTTFTILPLR